MCCWLIYKIFLEPLYDNVNGLADGTTAILGKYGAFVKSNFKPIKFDTPSDFASGVVFFLVYPFKLSERQVSADIEVRLWSGDESKQLAIIEGKSICDSINNKPLIQYANPLFRWWFDTDHFTGGEWHFKSHYRWPLYTLLVHTKRRGHDRIGSLEL